MANTIRVRDLSTNRADRYVVESVSGAGTWEAATLPASTEIEMLNDITAGTVTASQACVADANKTLRFGDWVGSAALTKGIAFTASLDTYGDGQIDILQVQVEAAQT